MAVAVDAQGNSYVTGWTGSFNFPVAAGAFDETLNGGRDAYVAKFRSDGTFVWGTYLGGSADDQGHAIAADSAGNVYVTGRTNSADFPTTPGGFDQSFNGNVDSFVVKLTADGSALAYSTFLGGTGFEMDQGFDALARFVGGIAVDSAGQAYVTGSTTSTDFPVTAGAFDTTSNEFNDVFVSKLNAAGSALVYSTYLGGSDHDRSQGLAIDANGNAYVTGEVWSGNFPTTAGAFQPAHAGGTDSFVTKLNPTGSALVYSSYLGGTGSEFPGRVAIDSTGAAYITGSTASFNFPTTAGSFQPVKAANGSDAFVTKVSPDGSTMVYSTHLGGTFGGESGSDIAVDSSGQAYVTGATGSGAFPVVNGFQGRGGMTDSFVTAFNAAGSALLYSSYLGGGRDDTARGIALDANRTAHVVGQTNSSGEFGLTVFPTTSNATQPTFRGGANDGFIVYVVSDTIAPTVAAKEFAFNDPPQRVVFTFSENVSASLGVDDLLLENLTTGQTIPSGNLALSYNATTNTATFTFPGYPYGALPNGNYRATLLAAGVSDVAGNQLAGNEVFTFFFVQGDGDHNGVINFDDYSMIDNGFNNGLRGFGNGDFNYDGVINFDDYAIIDLAFNNQSAGSRALRGGGSKFNSDGLIGGGSSRGFSGLPGDDAGAGDKFDGLLL